MSTPTFPELGGCGRPASGRIEVYSPARGQAYGSLDAVAYGCAEHINAIRQTLVAAGFTPYRTPYVPSYEAVPPVCGTLRRLGLPLTTSAAVTAVEGLSTAETPSAAVTAVQGVHSTDAPALSSAEATGHPAWCARVTDDGPCADVEYHASAWIAVDSVENDAPGIEAQLTDAGGLAVVLRFTYEDETTEQILPLDQAEALAAVLVDLVARGGGR